MTESQVLVVDDHTIVAKAFTDLILKENPDWKCHIVDSGQQALSLAAQLPHLDYIILDLFLQDMSGLFLLEQLKASNPDATYILVSASMQANHIQSAREAGVSAYIPKTLDHEALGPLLLDVLSGTPYFPAKETLGRDDVSIPSQALTDYPAHIDLEEKLTDRQRQIMRLLAQGKSNKDIARELYISQNTVKIHVSSILSLLNLENRTQAALLAKQLFQ